MHTHKILFLVLSHCSVFKVRQPFGFLSKSSGVRAQIALNSHIRTFGGDEQDRTVDLLLARQALSQLSYAPIFFLLVDGGLKRTRTSDLTLIRRAL